MALTIVLRPGARKTISAAALYALQSVRASDHMLQKSLTCAASEAPSTAIPQSDFFNDGASFTPSPLSSLEEAQVINILIHTSHSR